LSNVPLVGVQSLPGDPKLAQVTLEQLTDRSARAGVAPLVNLVEEPDARLLCLRRSIRAGRNNLAEDMPLPRDRINARVDADPQRTAGQQLDAAPVPLAPPPLSAGHEAIVRPVRATIRATTSGEKSAEQVNN
jgi:hypothetical protein